MFKSSSDVRFPLFFGNYISECRKAFPSHRVSVILSVRYSDMGHLGSFLVKKLSPRLRIGLHSVAVPETVTPGALVYLPNP